MRSVVTELVHLLFVMPFYLIVLLLVLAVRGWLQPGSVWGRWRNRLFGFALVVYFVSIPAFPNWAAAAIEGIHKVPAIPPAAATDETYIVVLSAGWFRASPDGYEIKLGEAGWERTDAAVALWKKIGGTLIFTGAPLPDGSDSVAQRMADLALRLGVPAERVDVEKFSKNTYENIAFCEQQFHLSRKHRVVLVSSGLHLPRAVAIASHLGIKVIPYPVDFRANNNPTWQMWIPSNDAGSASEEVLHEMVGLIAYRLRGWT